MKTSILVRHALSLPLGTAVRQTASWVFRQGRHRLDAAIGRWRCPYNAAHGAPVPRLPDTMPAPTVDADTADRWTAHYFNLLGSGWVQVAHGRTHKGFGANCYGPGRALPLTYWRNAVAAELPPGARRRARSLLSMIDDPAYRPIDWHVDFKSGFRWPPDLLGALCRFGHLPGIDVKVPWELGRLQHLPRLAGTKPAEARNQMLDFLASNPPGWGVNWACTMDVAIRGANLALAWDLLRGRASLSPDFDAELAAALRAHGRHVMAHLEWHPHHRGNHYLANIAGLAFIAAYLPADAEADAWLHFAGRELAAETLRQFDENGANFEASTAYHRLSAEMALFAVAVMLGLPSERRPTEFPAQMLARLAGACRFAADTTKPSGQMHQVGDNDSGRFFILDEDRPLEVRPLIRAGCGLFDLPFAEPGDDQSVEARVVTALAGGKRFPKALQPRPAVSSEPRASAPTPPSRRLRVEFPDPSALEGLQALAWPGFGLFIWRNKRAYVAVRCGPIGQNGNGGHAHNDQLAVEIEVDGLAYARDPGSFVYTPDLNLRDAYRSIRAHFCPRHGDAEPARLVAPFRLEDRAHARVLSFGCDHFLGSQQGFGVPVFRHLRFATSAIVIEDTIGTPADHAPTREDVVHSPEELAALWKLDIPFSPGYGLRING